MKSTQYERGRKKEYQWMNTLKELYFERDGYNYKNTVNIYRTAGSHGMFDIIVFDWKGKEIHGYQIKYLKDHKALEQEKKSKEFLDFIKPSKEIITTWKHYIIYLKGSNEPYFIYSGK